MLGPPSTNLADYAISPRNGFLPDEAPLLKLSDPYYLTWELTIDQLSQLLEISQLRHSIDRLPILSPSHLVSEQEWQRAYLILSFFTHGYIWESGGPSERLPPSISVPFLAISAHLGLPPTATYAGLNLWNWAPKNPSADLSDVNNLRTLYTFTGTPDESWFYLISVAIEAHGASIIPSMIRAIDATTTDNSHLVLSALTKFGFVVREIGVILKKMHEGCDPFVFYNKIRPFLAGSKNMSVAGLPRGVFYEIGGKKGAEEGEWRAYSGGSNAQSSLIQFFDVILGVEHHSKSGAKTSKNGFLNEMRTYMPGPHREFLNKLSSGTPIRDYCQCSPIPEVVDAYNFAVAELSAFRDIHIQIVTRYIIRPAKMANPPMKNPGLNLAIASSGAAEKGLHGTGGTELIPFLKQSRDETKGTALA